jgi:hypothetical protein
MEQFNAAVINPATLSRPRPVRLQVAGSATERLPFTIRRVETQADLLKAVRIRHAAYARHVPDFARSLSQPEAADYDADTIVLLAESKLDGTAIGSTRIRTNLHRPLGVEESVVLPDWLQGKRLVEATRLAVDYSVATGRPPVDRQYEQMLFVDVFPEDGLVPLRHVGNIPHRVMAFEIATFQQRWTEARHPMLDFFFNTVHPDIDIGPVVRPAMPDWSAREELAVA